MRGLCVQYGIVGMIAVMVMTPSMAVRFWGPHKLSASFTINEFSLFKSQLKTYFYSEYILFILIVHIVFSHYFLLSTYYIHVAFVLFVECQCD